VEVIQDDRGHLAVLLLLLLVRELETISNEVHIAHDHVCIHIPQANKIMGDYARKATDHHWVLLVITSTMSGGFFHQFFFAT